MRDVVLVLVVVLFSEFITLVLQRPLRQVRCLGLAAETAMCVALAGLWYALLGDGSWERRVGVGFLALGLVTAAAWSLIRSGTWRKGVPALRLTSTGFLQAQFETILALMLSLPFFLAATNESPGFGIYESCGLAVWLTAMAIRGVVRLTEPKSREQILGDARGQAPAPEAGMTLPDYLAWTGVAMVAGPSSVLLCALFLLLLLPLASHVARRTSRPQTALVRADTFPPSRVSA